MTPYPWVGLEVCNKVRAGCDLAVANVSLVYALKPVPPCTKSWLCPDATKSGLGGRQVGGEFAVSTAEQRRQLQALKALDTCLAALTAAAPGKLWCRLGSLFCSEARDTDGPHLQSELCVRCLA